MEEVNIYGVLGREGLITTVDSLFKFIARCLVLFAFASPAGASICAANLNVKDYYLSIPSEKLLLLDDSKGPLNLLDERERAISLLDISNGFIELQNETIISKYQIVLFRSSDRTPYIFITGDGPSVQNQYVFLCERDTWLDVTELFMPDISTSSATEMYLRRNILINGQEVTEQNLSAVAHTLVRYRLPRYGKEIELYASHPALSWDDLEPVYRFVPDFSSNNSQKI